jgi:tRNA threonylcarbamoyladenosine modification (KEOPS) complex Cgi121 subunit
VKFYRLNDNFICFIGIRTIGVSEVSELVTSIQRLSVPGVTVQLISARAAYGPSHLLGVLKITLECQKRNIALSLKPEMDLLLRLSFTNQITSALSRTGLKRFHPAIVILYSRDKKKLASIRGRIIETLPDIDDTVLTTSNESRDHIFRLLKMSKDMGTLHRDDDFIIQYIIERSALIMK